MAGKVIQIGTKKEGAGPGRSALGMHLSNMSEALHPAVSDTVGDVGIKYDRKSRLGRLGTLAAVSLLGAGVLISGVKTVEGMIDHEKQALIDRQDKAAVGKHPLISFTVKGEANVRDDAAPGGDVADKLVTGDKVVCAPEIVKRDITGTDVTWAMITKEDGTLGFVNMSQNSAVKPLDNPKGCPKNVAITLSTGNEASNFAGRYVMAGIGNNGENKPLPNSAGTIQR